MALSTLSGAFTQGMNNLKSMSEGIVQPLDAIEARRAARAAEQQEQQKADAAAMKAMAQKQAAAEAQAAGEAKRAAAARTQQIMSNMPKIDVKNMSDPEFTQQLRGQIQHLQNSGDPTAMEVSKNMMAQLKTFAETGGIDEGTAQGALRQADVEAQKSQTQLNRSMTNMNTTDATKADREWAAAFIHQNDPGRQGMFNFKANYTPEERVLKSNELATILDQVKRNYAASNGGAQMPTAEAQNAALAEFARLENSQGGQPQAQPQAQQAPQQQAPASQGGGKIDFDWSK